MKNTALSDGVFLHNFYFLKSLSGMESDKKRRNVPENEIKQHISRSDRLGMAGEGQIEHQKQAADAADCAQNQVGAHCTGQLVCRLVHLCKGLSLIHI